MSARGVLVIGNGKRVRETATPAFHRLPDQFEIRGVFAKRAKEIELDGRSYAVRAIDDLGAAALEGIDLVYCAVTKDAVPSVLARLAALDVSRTDLLIDTPVVRFKHFRHTTKLQAFRNAWVAEDCVYLPWIEAVRAVIAGGAIGEASKMLFHRSAYAYHGVATAKAVFGAQRVARGRRVDTGDGLARRTLALRDSRVEIEVTEPRDYSQGTITIQGSEGIITDDPDKRSSATCRPLDVRVEDGEVTALTIGDEVFPFDSAEQELLRGDAPDLYLTPRMDSLKRVGFLRLVRSIANGKGGYPVDAALEDTVVDYYLEKFGRYRATPITDPGAPLARMILKLITRAGG